MTASANISTSADRTGAAYPSDDAKAFRRGLSQFGTGVTVVTAQHDGVLTGVTANSFSSVSLDPPLILWSLARTSSGFEVFTQAKNFAINILHANQIDIAQNFARSGADKFNGVPWHSGGDGAPVIDGVVATFECTTFAQHEGGDHVIFVGRVDRFHFTPSDVLLFVQGQYAVAGMHPNLLPVAKHSEQSQSSDLSNESLKTLLYRADRYVSTVFQVHRAEAGLDLEQSRVLFTVAERPDASRDAIADEALLGRNAVDDAVAALTSRNLLTDNGFGGLHLTRVGEELLNVLTAKLAAVDEEITASIPQPTMTVIRRFLKDLANKDRQLRSTLGSVPTNGRVAEAAN